MGFREDIERISRTLPSAPLRQTFLFSATVSRPIQEIASKLLARQHTFVNCVSDADAATHAHIPQYTTTLPSGADAVPHILRLIAHDQLLCAQEGRKSKVIIFLSTTKMTQLFADILSAAAATSTPRRGRATPTTPALFPLPTRTYEMHAKRDMSRRINVSASFRADVAPHTGSVLITSDVSARGVDYPGVTRVIQLGVPASPDMYVHRVGRTGRGGDCAGRGRADTVLCGEWETPAVTRIARVVGTKASSVTVDQLARECEEMVVTDPRANYSAANLGEIEAWATALTARIGQPDYVPPNSKPEAVYPGRTASETISGTFMAQLGFYIGRTGTTGLTTEGAARGLQKFFGEMCALTRDLQISRTLLSAMGGGGGFGGRGGSRGGGGGRGGYASRGSGGGYESRGSSGGYASRGSSGGYESRGSSGGYASRGESGGSFESRRGSGGYGAKASDGGYAPRGSEDREGYRGRSNSGGATGYTSAAPPRRLNSWEGATGRERGGSSGGGRSTPSWGQRGSSSSRGRAGREEY